MKIVTFKIDEDLLDMLDLVRRIDGVYSRSEAIRKAIRLYIDKVLREKAAEYTGRGGPRIVRI